MRSTLTAAAVSAALTLTGAATAHATAQTTPQVQIYMTSTSTSCDGTIHAVLSNNSTTDEIAIVYMEQAAGNTLGVSVTNKQPTPTTVPVPHGADTDVTLPYEDGNAVFMAVAVAQGDTVPTMWQSSPAQPTDLKVMRAAGTAADSELFPPYKLEFPTYQEPNCPAATAPPAATPKPTAKPTVKAEPKPSSPPTSTHPVSSASSVKPSAAPSTSLKLAEEPVTDPIPYRAASTTTTPAVTVTGETPATASVALAQSHSSSTASALWFVVAGLIAFAGVAFVVAGNRRRARR